MTPEERMERLEKALGAIQGDIGEKILKVVAVARSLEDDRLRTLQALQDQIDALALKVKDLQMQINALERRR